MPPTKENVSEAITYAEAVISATDRIVDASASHCPRYTPLGRER
jgi:hypothetical protein